MVKFIVLLLPLLVFSKPIEQASKKANPPKVDGRVKIYQKGENFIFEVCEPECKSVGRKEGYSRAEIEEWKKFRENSFSDIMPVIGLVAGLCLFIGSMVFLPLTVGLLGMASIAGALGYFLYKTPQVQAGMTNAVYKEFSADPGMLSELRTFLKELDEGMVTSDKNPRVLSSRTIKNSRSVEVPDGDKTIIPAK